MTLKAIVTAYETGTAECSITDGERELCSFLIEVNVPDAKAAMSAAFRSAANYASGDRLWEGTGTAFNLELRASSDEAEVRTRHTEVEGGKLVRCDFYDFKVGGHGNVLTTARIALRAADDRLAGRDHPAIVQ